ncbi:terminase large subunit [Roseobacter phage RDJL6]|nr:terminase large subunit [Roseobacter phage RDJL6]
MPALQIPYAFRELWYPARHKAFYGGRGGAKSHSFADVLVAQGYKRKDFRWLFAREIQNSLNASVKQLLEDKIKAQGLGPREEGGNGYYRITDRSITGGDGRTEFLFAGLRTNPDSVKSMEGLDGAWVEEANKVSQRSINLLTPTVRKPGSELWWSWNRTDVKDPVDNLFLGGTPPPRSIVRKVGWEDNPWFPPELHEEMMWDKARDRDKWLHTWEGHPVTMSEARVFKNWSVEDIDSQVPEGCTPRLGADWGFANDPSVLILCYVFGRTLYIRKERWKLKLEVDHTPSFWVGDDWLHPDKPRWTNPLGFEGMQEARTNRVIADSARPEVISYMAKRGFNVIASKKGPGSVVEGVEFLKSFDVVIHPECQHVIDEWTHYSYETDPITDEVLSKLADKKNHTVDSVRYALENIRRATGGRVGLIAPETIPLKD